MKGLIAYINHKKWLKATISSVLIVAIYFVCCSIKYMPKNLNVLHLFDDSNKTVTKEGYELVPLGDKMYFQDKLVDGGFYKINDTLSIPLSELCDALDYEYTTDDDKTVIKTDTEVRALEISSTRYLENDGESKGENDFKELNHKIIKYNDETYIAYDDVSTVFNWLKTATLKSGKKCVYDPEPFIPIGVTLEQSYDEMAKAYAGEGKLLTIDEYRKIKKIPTQISLDTDQNIFFNTMSMSSYYGDEYPAMAESLKRMGVGEDVLQNGNAQYGKVMDELTIAQVIQSNNVQGYIEDNGLTEDLIGFKVDKDTKFKLVRNVKTINEIDQNEKEDELDNLEVTIAPTDSPEPTTSPDPFASPDASPSTSPDPNASPSATAVPMLSPSPTATKKPVEKIGDKEQSKKDSLDNTDEVAETEDEADNQ